jgi:hypothetical protein
MHNFSELIDNCTVFTLAALKEVEVKTMDALQTSGATHLVKALQMIRLEKTILAVGIFSMFEAILQDRLNCSNGFAEARNILEQNGELKLLSRFSDLELAINALKHGRGRSYNALVAKNGGTLNSKVKQPDDYFFDEGDVSEISTLVDVDDNFLNSCVETIKQVSKKIEKIRSEISL